jgi:hypothetical protein
VDKGFFIFLSLDHVGEPSVMVLTDFVCKETQGYRDIAGRTYGWMDEWIGGWMKDQPVSNNMRYPLILSLLVHVPRSNEHIKTAKVEIIQISDRWVSESY